MIPGCSSARFIRYRIDTMATALMITLAPCYWPVHSKSHLPDVLTARLAAFVRHAWNPDARRFRNFMSFDRRWLEEKGSEDSHGRTLWALGGGSRGDTSLARRRWATALFEKALPAVEDFQSPRAWAFTLLGLDAYLEAAQGAS